jgi:hypothetical protein
MHVKDKMIFKENKNYIMIDCMKKPMCILMNL